MEYIKIFGIDNNIYSMIGNYKYCSIEPLPILWRRFRDKKGVICKNVVDDI